MKQIKKFLPVLLAVIVLAAVSVVPAFAQEPTPPVVEVIEVVDVAPPVFDWSKISNALEDLLTAFLLPTVGFAARWMWAKGNVEYSKLTDSQKAKFRAYLESAVYAAEQMKLKDEITDKFGYVMKKAEGWLAANRLKIDLTDVALEVKAIVAHEFNMGKILAPKLPKTNPPING
jgi:hypothetical protein